MSRVDHWSRYTDRADEIRKQTAAFEAAMREEFPAIEEKDTPIDLDAAKAIVAQKEAEIDRLCLEIEAMRLPLGPLAGRRIAISVAKAHGLTFKEMISRRRNRNIAWARQHAMWEIKKHTKLSLPQIGHLLGGLDHTTVLHGIRAHQSRLDAGLL